MTDAEKREAARMFYYKWNGRGKEDEDDRSYWIDILQDLMGLSHVTDRIEFQKKVVGPDGNTKRIDAYIPETRVLIEQKSLNIALDKPQSGHDGMTPYEQAKMYDNSLPHSEKAKWIVLSNFAEIWIYDMDERVPEPIILKIENLQTQYSMLDFLEKKEKKVLTKEMELSLKAGDLVGKIYDRFLEQYSDPEASYTQKSLNILCVRIVFCLYAEDAGLFGERDAFSGLLTSYEPKDMRRVLLDLFKVLDTPIEERAELYLDDDLASFPYVNGGLFKDENIIIPKITDEIKMTLIESAKFNWSEISPTIFGAVFESTLNPETRRSGGMHYTSIEYIHKVIDPLFLDDLKSELEKIKSIDVKKTRDKELKVFQEKLASLTFFDPACGSGNFLTETYVSIRRLENQVLLALSGGQISMADINYSPIKVNISQFYGIEINDFAVTVAKTALWIAESQMMKETEDVVRIELEFLPLKTNAYIHEDNALRLDWNCVIHKNKLSYIIGNPPFVGFRWASEDQKADLDYVFENKIKRSKLDFVTGWFYKAAQFIQGTNIKVALLSTNSITQGEHVAVFWNYVLEKYPVNFNFAHTTFIWKNEATNQAHVHCVIIGFAAKKDKKIILYTDGNPKEVESISPYLTEAPAVVIEKQKTPISGVKPLVPGCQASDGGAFMFDEEQYNELLLNEPQSAAMLKQFMMGYEFLNKVKRYCIWIPDKELIELDNHPIIKQRIRQVAEFRKQSSNKQIKEKANTPTKFDQFRPPTSNYIAFARVSSQRRRYIPIGFLTDDIIPGDKLFTIPDGDLYMFGILSSNVHAAWLRVTGGRLKSDYSYSSQMVYNTFPWPDVTKEQKDKIIQTAQGILDARKKYEKYSLAKMYDPDDMPSDLKKAHQQNDIAVEKAYGFDIRTTTEADCVSALMQMYKKMTSK